MKRQLAAALSAAPLLCAAAYGDDGTSAATSTVPTIVISPEFRPQNQQRTSKTVTAHTARELDNAGVNDSLALQYETPGLVTKTNSVLGQPYLRGVGSDIISAAADPSVAIFVDGVYMPRATHAIQDFFDLDRVEVIKGPQGIHLGRNVVGGAISIHTLDPVPYRSGYGDVLYGNHDKRQLRVALNEPLGDTPFTLRLAGLSTLRDGFSENTFLGGSADDEDSQALRGKISYRNGDSFDALLNAEYAHEDSSRALAHHPDPDAGVNAGILLGGEVPADEREITHNVRPRQNMDTGRYYARLNWRTDALKITSTSAWITDDVDIALDLDATNADFAANYPRLSSRALSQELRIASRREAALSWSGGLFFMHEATEETIDVQFPFAAAGNYADGASDLHSLAAFGQLVYRMTGRLNLKAGLRYTRDERTADVTQTVTDPGGALGPPGIARLTQKEQQEWDAVTPELTLEYALQRDRLLYVSASRGFKSGGYNLTAVQPAFDPEYLQAWEAGFKSLAFSRRLLFNTALFHYDYDDMQLLTPPSGAPLGTFPIVINAARASIDGMDLEARYQPAWNYGLSLRATLLDADFERFDSRDPNNPADDPDRSGNALPQAPEFSFNASAHYTWTAQHGEWTLRAGYHHQSRIWFNVYSDPDVKQDAYGLVDASLNYESRKGRWHAQLYGRNLTDQLYAQSIIRQDPLVGILRWWGAPRTFGCRLGMRF